MEFKHDYSYIRNKELIDLGYADMDVHSLNFDRYYTEEEKKQNSERAKAMTSEEHTNYCKVISKEVGLKLLGVLNELDKKYDIHRVSKEKSTSEHYRSNWDLFFYSNKGWNGQDHFDHMKISFNDRRNLEDNKQLLSEIMALLESLDVDGIMCRIQHDLNLHEDEIEKKAEEISEELLGRFVLYNDMMGKIKVVSDEDGIKTYGFFKKGAKKKYYTLSNSYLVARFA